MTPEQVAENQESLQEEQVVEQVTEEQKEVAEKLGVVQEKDETEENYGKRVQKRINELTKKVHDKDRETEAIIKQTKADFEAMADQNRQLKESIDRMTKATEAVAEHTKPKPQDPFIAIDSEIKTLKARKLEAYDIADFKAIAMIDDRLDELKDKKYEIRLQREKDELAQKIDKKTQEPPNAVNSVVESWIEETEWYNLNSDKYDPIMVGAAIKLEEVLADDPAWKNKSVRQRLNEVKRRVEDKFSYGKTKAPPNTVEGVSNMSTGEAKTITLSEDQKYVARMMFKNMTPKDAEKKYAQYMSK